MPADVEAAEHGTPARVLLALLGVSALTGAVLLAKHDRHEFGRIDCCSWGPDAVAPAPVAASLLGIGVGGALAVLLGPLPAHSRPRRCAAALGRIAAGLAVGLVAIEPGLGDQGQVPWWLTTLVAAAALGLLAWERVAAAEGVRELPSPPPLHRAVARSALAGAVSLVPSALVLSLGDGAVGWTLPDLLWVLAAFGGLGAAVWAGLVAFSEAIALRLTVRHRALVLVLAGLVSPLAIVLAGSWAYGMYMYDADSFAVWGVVHARLGDILDQPSPFVAFSGLVGWALVLLGSLRLGLASRGLPEPLVGQAVLLSIGLAGAFAALAGLAPAGVRSAAADYPPAVWMVLLPWALVLGLEGGQRLEAWLAARWERRWAD